MLLGIHPYGHLGGRSWTQGTSSGCKLAFLMAFRIASTEAMMWGSYAATLGTSASIYVCITISKL